jgi:hypothetical protein
MVKAFVLDYNKTLKLLRGFVLKMADSNGKALAG